MRIPAVVVVMGLVALVSFAQASTITVHVGGLEIAARTYAVALLDNRYVVLGSQAGVCFVDGHDAAHPALVSSVGLSAAV